MKLVQIYSLALTLFIFRSTSAQCTNDTVCLPLSLNGTSTSLVNCTSSQCECKSECFELNTSSNTCTLVSSPCYSYSSALGECQSSAPRKITALLLSLFVGTTGADNFYINRFDFAIPQLILFLSPLCGCFTLCFYSGCAVFLSSKRNWRPLAHCMHCSALIIATLAAIVFPLTTTAWNIADIFAIAFNEHFDANGCQLKN